MADQTDRPDEGPGAAIPTPEPSAPPVSKAPTPKKSAPMKKPSAAKKTPAKKAGAKKAPAKKAAAKKPAPAKKTPAKKTAPPPADLAESNGHLTSAAKEAAAQAKSTVASASNTVSTLPLTQRQDRDTSRLPVAAALAAGVLAILAVLYLARRSGE